MNVNELSIWLNPYYHGMIIQDLHVVYERCSEQIYTHFFTRIQEFIQQWFLGRF